MLVLYSFCIGLWDFAHSYLHSATSIALVTTVINAAVLYTMDGEEMIWICFGSCAADVSPKILQ